MPSRCDKCNCLLRPTESCACLGTKSTDKNWTTVRREVKPWFEAAGYTHCELKLIGCNEAIGTGFAHAKKRRHLANTELYIVAFLCNNCHDKIEGKPFMEQTILNIRKRNPIPEIDTIINEQYGNKNRTTT